MSQSFIDINNDGSKEVVLKFSGHMGDVPTESMDILNSADIDRKDEYIAVDIIKSKSIMRIGSFDKNQYYLKELPAQKIYHSNPSSKETKSYCHLNGGYVDPLIYKDKVFVEMQSSYYTEDNSFFDWRIILEVTPENKLQDICYCMKITSSKGQDCSNE